MPGRVVCRDVLGGLLREYSLEPVGFNKYVELFDGP
jgi:hypothetical protein